MSKTPITKNKVSRKRLSLIKEDASVSKHPSVKNLLNQMNNPEPIPLINNNIAIDNDKNNNQINYDNTNLKTNIGINIITCEHKIIDDKDTFFVQTNENNNKKKLSLRNSLNIKKSIFYEFNDEQKKVDKKITNLMEKGKDYKAIEKQFQGLLKK